MKSFAAILACAAAVVAAQESATLKNDNNAWLNADLSNRGKVNFDQDQDYFNLGGANGLTKANNDVRYQNIYDQDARLRAGYDKDSYIAYDDYGYGNGYYPGYGYGGYPGYGYGGYYDYPYYGYDDYYY